ncbi:MAG: heavy metal translocating P-type ATPase [Desulfovibrionales bacterium]|nr:heavy metal translocating P-type ATPase [Desulfovibrionales bacterium]
MQRFIFRNKNNIMFINGVFIALGFSSHWVLKNDQMFMAALIIASVIGVLPIALQAFQALRLKIVSIDVLVTLAVTGAFLIQNFEESAIVIFLFLFGAFLEQRTLNQTRSAIKALTEMAPESALKQMADGQFADVDVDDVDVGDILLVKTGAKVPVDGTVVSGAGSINEASITGESMAVEKDVSSFVYAGTIVENGTIQIRAERVGEDTTFGKIIELVEEAQDAKSDAERFIDRFSRYYTPAVLGIAFAVYLVTFNVELAIIILVLGCPGALVIGVPVSNVAGIGNGAKHGILLKGSEVIHSFSKTNAMIFDKTGTLTMGNPAVSQTLYFDSAGHICTQGAENLEPELVDARTYLASIEHESSHPLAKAVLSELGITELHPVENTQVAKGAGIVATVKGKRVAVGNVSLMESEQVFLPEAALHAVTNLQQAGNSLVFTSVNGQLHIIMGVRDQIRPHVRSHLQALQKLGVHDLIMLSGDNQGTVDVVGRELGLTNAYGNMLPENKSAFVQKLKAQGKTVTFVGDGINDSPSLALADIGIAMGSGTDVAIETSDVVLMNSDFSRLPHALGLAKATARNMIQNITIAVGVVVFLLASLIFSDWMNMSIGMLVHEGSILAVVVNGMRLLRYKIA